jgi:methylglutaconyl-CoA hydratase
MADELRVEAGTAAGVVELMLNRPERRNALNIALLEAILAEFERLEDDDSVRAVILKGAGPVFCSGMDLAEARDHSLAHRSADLVGRCITRVHHARFITIASVHGAALAGGAGLMSVCDFAVASAESKLGYPEVHRGMVPALVLTILRRQLRERDIRELALLGELIPAERALAMGLISHVTAEGESLPTARALAERITRTAPVASALTKRLIEDFWPGEFDRDILRAHEVHVDVRESGEAAEGMQAFLEKREPSWKLR